MDARELIPFLGHGSIHAPFDEFLTRHGFARRPRVGARLETLLPVDGTGLDLGFDFSETARERNMPVKSEGGYVFDRIEIVLISENKKAKVYKGMLPYNLNAADTRAEVEGKLGAPRRRNEESDNYYLDGLVWTAEFSGPAFSGLRIELPDDGWRKYGICP